MCIILLYIITSEQVWLRFHIVFYCYWSHILYNRILSVGATLSTLNPPYYYGDGNDFWFRFFLLIITNHIFVLATRQDFTDIWLYMIL